MAHLSMHQRSHCSTTAGPTMCRSFLETNRNASVTSSDWLWLPNPDDSQQGRFAPRTLLRFVATIGPADTRSPVADFPVDAGYTASLLHHFRDGARRACWD